MRQTTKMASDNEQKLDELNRKLGVQEEELRRAVDRAELAEKNLKGIEEELQMVGENMKQLEQSAEKAVEREEKLKDKILSIQSKYKLAEGRFEYGEMNITKLNQRIDDIEDEIYRDFEYTYEGTEFTTAQIKIIMTSQNQCYVPTIKNLRVIALSDL